MTAGSTSSCKSPLKVGVGRDAAEGSSGLRVLFVGNSLTYQNDLPRMIAALAKSRGHDMQYEVYAPGGYRLSQHAADAKLRTYEGMQRRINAAYAEMAKDNRGLLVPVGLLWKEARATRAELGLYADDTHPSPVGSYLAACVFYAVLFESSPIGAAHPPSIDDATATFLQTITSAALSK